MAVRQITLQYIGQDLDTCRQEIQRIDEQMEQFRAKREALVFRLDNLSSAYEKAKAESEAQVGSTANQQDLGANETRVDPASTAYMSSGTLEGLGFRDAVRQVLADASKGMRPKEISKAMIDRGYKYDGKTELSARMANELSRMTKSHSVRKRGHLYYRIG